MKKLLLAVAALALLPSFAQAQDGGACFAICNSEKNHRDMVCRGMPGANPGATQRQKDDYFQCLSRSNIEWNACVLGCPREEASLNDSKASLANRQKSICAKAKANAETIAALGK